MVENDYKIPFSVVFKKKKTHKLVDIVSVSTQVSITLFRELDLIFSLAPTSSFLAIWIPGGSSHSLKLRGSCHLHGRLGLSFQFLFSAWSTLGWCVHTGSE